MAFRVFPLYNLGTSVGKGGINKSDDVKVVQGLLQIIFSDVRSNAKAEQFSKKLGITLDKPPTPTGFCDTNLLNYILVFQSYSPTFAQDGRIDPVPGGLAFDIDPKFKSGKQYQLWVLNKTALFVSVSEFMKLGDKIAVSYYARLDGTDIYG